MVDGEALERMVSHSVSERRMKAGSRREMQKGWSLFKARAKRQCLDSHGPSETVRSTDQI
jgi:hypothetical protein